MVTVIIVLVVLALIGGILIAKNNKKLVDEIPTGKGGSTGGTQPPKVL